MSNSETTNSHAETTSASSSGESVDTLVVVSKVKKLIREKANLNTSSCCIEAITKKVADECMKGIQRAREANRKTVMGRDIL